VASASGIREDCMLFSRKNPYSELEKSLGYRFRSRDLLATALTHPSYRFENADVSEDNQRLEFLGDAVLGFLTASYFYRTMVDKDEGVLTTVRSRITSGKALAALARSIDLGKYLRVGKGEEASGGRSRHSSLADALEAIVGAAYLDTGMKGVEKVFAKLFADLIGETGDDVWKGNPKGKLQEYVQARWRTNPVYRLAGQSGTAHSSVFTVEVVVNGKVAGRGSGSTKQISESHAAAAALVHFEGVVGQ
jgi:ribonuclease III